MNTANYKKASFYQRACAFLIDTIIDLIIIGSLLYFISTKINNPGSEFTLIDWILPAIYGTIFIWRAGATPGKMILKIKVVTTTYKPVSLRSAFLREMVGKIISNIIFGMGFLWALLDKKNQTWHDKIANTYVVKLDNNHKLIPVTKNETVTHKRIAAFWALLLTIIICTALYFYLLYIYVFKFNSINVSI